MEILILLISLNTSDRILFLKNEWNFRKKLTHFWKKVFIWWKHNAFDFYKKQF